MKTAVSIPKEIFDAAEKRAQKLGASRSQLYAKAIEQLLKRDAEFDDEITAQINEVCKELDTSMDTVFKKLQSRALAEPW